MLLPSLVRRFFFALATAASRPCLDCPTADRCVSRGHAGGALWSGSERWGGSVAAHAQARRLTRCQRWGRGAESIATVYDSSNGCSAVSCRTDVPAALARCELAAALLWQLLPGQTGISSPL